MIIEKPLAPSWDEEEKWPLLLGQFGGINKVVKPLG